MRVKVVFTKCRHNPKRLAHNPSFRYAILSCSIAVDGEEFHNLSCLVQHPHDTDESNLIISRPATYTGPFDLPSFSSCAKDYYRLSGLPVTERDGPQTDRDVFMTKEYTFEVEG